MVPPHFHGLYSSLELCSEVHYSQAYREMDVTVERVSLSCKRERERVDLTISIKSTDVMFQSAPGEPYHEPHITAKGQDLQAVDNFTYLGSTMSK